MAGVLEVLVERGAEVSQDVVLLVVRLSLLVDALLWLLVSAADLVEENVRDFTIGFPVDVGLTLENIDIADAVIVSWSIERKHLVDELAVHEVVHIEDG